jgi:hypothetical protein
MKDSSEEIVGIYGALSQEGLGSFRWVKFMLTELKKGKEHLR